jgi:hypothetical protein
MTEQSGPLPLLQGLRKSDYTICTLEDEIRVDRLCVDLLRRLFQDLTLREKMPNRQAGDICQGADYFLREFIVGDRRENLFDIQPVRVRQFAGHWYIVRTPEPNLNELRSILEGVAALYRFLARHELIVSSYAESIAAHCHEFGYYQQRIDDFWAIENDGFDTWRRECPLEPVTHQP